MPLPIIPATIDIYQKVGDLKAYPEFEAAKNGDALQAAALVQKFIQPEYAHRIAANVRRHNAVLLPVYGHEDSGANCIPAASAAWIAALTGIQTADGIIRKTPDSRTHQDGMARIFNTPVFSGDVVSGQNYYLIDDTVTQGGTLAALARHLYANDAIAVGATVLTGQQRSATLAITEPTLNQVNAHFKELENDFHTITNRRFIDLTESEGSYIIRASIVQRFGDEVAARRVAKEHGIDHRGVSQTGIRGEPNSNVIGKTLSPYEIGKLTNTKPASTIEATSTQVISTKKGLGLG